MKRKGWKKRRRERESKSYKGKLYKRKEMEESGEDEAIPSSNCIQYAMQALTFSAKVREGS